MRQKIAKRKIPKWQKALSKEDRIHLAEIHAKTKKSFVELNQTHNMRRAQALALEPCFTCKGIARKMGLPVHARGELKVVATKEPLKTEKPAELNTKTKFQAVRLVVHKKKERKSMRIVDIKCPILRRLCLCSFIAPCVAYVMVVSSWAALKSSWSAGCETFTELWEGDNGKTSKGFD